MTLTRKHRDENRQLAVSISSTDSPGLRLKRTAFENRLLTIKPREKSLR